MNKAIVFDDVITDGLDRLIDWLMALDAATSEAEYPQRVIAYMRGRLTPKEVAFWRDIFAALADEATPPSETTNADMVAARKWAIVCEMEHWEGNAGVDLRYWAPSVVYQAEQAYLERYRAGQ